mgnify:CR=1 FL=1
MGETLEYLEALADNEDWEELENCGESPYDWGKMENESAEDINKENKIIKTFMLKSVQWKQITIKNPICPNCRSKSIHSGFRYDGERKLKLELFTCPKCKRKGEVKP